MLLCTIPRALKLSIRWQTAGIIYCIGVHTSALWWCPTLMSTWVGYINAAMYGSALSQRSLLSPHNQGFFLFFLNLAKHNDETERTEDEQQEEEDPYCASVVLSSSKDCWCPIEWYQVEGTSICPCSGTDAEALTRPTCWSVQIMIGPTAAVLHRTAFSRT